MFKKKIKTLMFKKTCMIHVAMKVLKPLLVFHLKNVYINTVVFVKYNKVWIRNK